MIHLNGNLLCVIDTETTGSNPQENAIWQFTCIPLDSDIKPHKSLPVYDILMKPWSPIRNTDAISKHKFEHAVAHGMLHETAANLFHEWYERLNLPLKKRIIPLAHNWPFDRDFTIQWLGRDSCEYYFDPRYRDTMALAASLCDSSVHHGEYVPFSKMQLRTLARTLEVDWDDGEAHDSLYDAYKTAEIYRKMVQKITFIV